MSCGELRAYDLQAAERTQAWDCNLSSRSRCRWRSEKSCVFILNVVSVAPRLEKRSALITAARRVAGEIVGPQYSLAAAADRLQEAAEVHGITEEIGQDAVQHDLAKALEDPAHPRCERPLFSADGTSIDVNAEICGWHCPRVGIRTRPPT